MMISKFSIKGFKGFDQLDIPSLSRITLVGGRNNVGKTSVLEALFMFHDRFNPEMILRQFAWRGVGTIPFNPESMWMPVFYNYEMGKKIEIDAVVNSNDEKMTLKYNPSYTPATIPANNTRPGFRPTQIKTDQKPEPSFSLDITYDSKKMKNQTAHLLMGLNGFGIHLDSTNIERRNAAFLGARVAVNPTEDAQKFGQLDMPQIWEAIALAAREYDCQVICTTHSYECLEAAYEGLSGDLASDFSYIRIDRTDNKTAAKYFDHEMLKIAIDTNMEVR
ncbi:MAG: AAA family ATPase [Desulfuromonadaceae bacterium]|nr:AAA family ATPase [Desulfuromonadaceae bacterium]MDD2856713.1 AAA family ATPase [Desulfuromonadaceae bacterium]